MKVLVIMGSPRKGNTYRAAERIWEILQSYGLVEYQYWKEQGWLEPVSGIMPRCRSTRSIH